MFKCIFFIFFGMNILNVSAQSLQELQFESFDEKNGLSNNWIRALAIDSIGFLWISTEDGLNRYDGHRFKQFKHDPQNENSLFQDVVGQTYVDKNGNVWISYPSGDFSLYKDECACFTHFHTNKVAANIIDEGFGIRFIDAEGNPWFSGDGLGLNKFVIKNNQIIHYDLPSDPKRSELKDDETKIVNFIYEDSRGLLWLCTDHGLYSFNRKTNSFSYKKYGIASAAGKRKDCFNKLIPDGQKGFWLSAFNGGLSYFNLSDTTFRNFSFESKDYGYNNLIFDFAVKSPQQFWIVSGDKGLGVFDKQSGLFEFKSDFINRDGSKFSFLKQIVITPMREMFLADETSLLEYIPNSNFFNFVDLPIQKSQHGNLFVIRKILENPALNEIYFTTELGNGLNILNTNNNKLTALSVEVNEKIDKKIRLKNIIFSGEHSMLLLTRDYLYSFSPKEKILHKLQPPPDGSNSNVPNTFINFIQDGDRALYVLTTIGTIHRFDVKRNHLSDRIFIKENKQEIQKADYAVFDSSHKLWVIGNGKVAYQTFDNLTFKFVHDSLLTSYLTKEIKAISADKKGNIWLALANFGLLKINTKQPNNLQYKLYSKSNKLPTNRIFNMGIDPFDNVWMSTIMGAVYFDATKEEHKLFNQIVGMNKYIHGMRFIQGGGESFYITVPGKYCKVDFNKISQTKKVPKVFIDQLNVAKQKISISTDNKKLKINLKSNQNFFSFDFGCLDFSNQSYHQFAYQLEGWDKEWQYCGNRRFANYTNVSGGDFTFKVKAANANGQWSETKSLKLFVQTPFYKTIWFRLLFVLLIAGLLAAFYQYRLKQHKQLFDLTSKTQLLEKEKTMVMFDSLKQQLNPHFLFNSLTSLSGLIQINQELAGDFLEQMSGIYRYILKNAESELVSLKDEIEFVTLYTKLQQTRFKSGLLINIDVAPEYWNQKIAPVTLQNMIENAIKHNIIDNDSPLVIEIFVENDYLVVKNNLQKKSKVETSNKKGLKQFETLYQYLSQLPILVEETQTYFSIKIPLI